MERLRDLNARGRFEDVIHEFESGGMVSNEATLGEYVKALVKLDRLDGSLLLNTLNARLQNSIHNDKAMFRGVRSGVG